MDDNASFVNAPSEGPFRRLPAWLRTIGWTLALGCEAGALIWFINCLATGEFGLAGWLGQFILATALAAFGTMLVNYRLRTIYLPLRKLQTLLPQIRAGEAPIEELSRIGGRLLPIASQIQSLMRDLRQQQAETNFELRERVANRTSALERTIGSLRQQASRDGLTGLYNRRAFDEVLAKAIERWKTHAESITLLMIDVDHFKILNDVLGHAVGDELLRSVAQIIRSSIRPQDHAFRWGGDEFAIVLEESDAAAGKAMADRLVSLVDGLAKTYRVPLPPRLSIGVSNLADLPAPTAETFVAAADRVLYAVKANRKKASRLAS
jgi:diguanylate cyclase (GGDEF)-like protein